MIARRRKPTKGCAACQRSAISIMHCRRQVKSDAAATIRGHAGGNSEQPAHRVLLGHRIPARGEDGLQGVAHGADKYIRDDEPQTCRA